MISLICLVIPHFVTIYRDMPMVSQSLVMISQSNLSIEQLELLIKSQDINLESQRNFIDLQKHFANLFMGVVMGALGFGSMDKIVVKDKETTNG